MIYSEAQFVMPDGVEINCREYGLPEIGETMTIEKTYLVANESLKSKFDDLMEKRSELLEAATEYAQELGGSCVVSQGRELLGVVFEEQPARS